MRLLLVADLAYPDHGGGSHRLYYEVTKRLAQRGHEVHLVTGKVTPDAPDEEWIEGVCYHRLIRDRRNFVSHGLSYVLGARRVFQQLAREGPFDAISAHYVLPTLGVLATRERGATPIIFTFHGPWAGEFAVELEWGSQQGSAPARVLRMAKTGAIVSVARVLEWFALWRSARVHALSSYMANLAANQYHVPLARRVIIPGGVDTEKFSPPPDKAAARATLGLPPERPVLLTVRRLYARMGLTNLVQAMRQVVQERPDALLLIGGKGPLQPHLETLIEQSGLEENVRLLGFVPEEDLPLYYQAADLFVLPSVELEGFGLVTLEALASGTPVLGTAVGGTVEILQRLDPTLLVPSANPSEIAEGILRFLANPAPSPEACRRYVLGHYSWDRMVDALEALFQNPSVSSGPP
ncbi:MAG TPA: glycosyltransferase family 4 protein [Ardenticatenaceae bacterium]